MRVCGESGCGERECNDREGGEIDESEGCDECVVRVWW